jgi:hypothetical protein
MPHTTFQLVRPLLAVLALPVLGCGSDLVLPESPGSAAQSVALSKVNGDGQNGTVGERLSIPLRVQVLNALQQGVSGLTVTFQVTDPAGGTIDPAEGTTNSAGEAVTNWTLGTVPGTYSVVARLVGVEGEDKVAEFQAHADAGPPSSLTSLSPLEQPGRREQPVRTAPVVQVLDQFGNPVPGVPVQWQVIAGDGQATAGGDTDAEGKASVSWTLGDEAGIQKLSAAVSGVGASVVFEAHVLF